VTMGFWEIQLAGSWKSLGRVVGTACNEAQGRGATQLKFVSHGQSYLIDFKTMTQTNVNSGKTRPIRNKSAHRHSDAVHVHPRPSAAPAAPAPVSVPSAPGAGTYPHITAPDDPAVTPAAPECAAPAKTSGGSGSFLGRWLGRAAGYSAGVAAVGGTGLGLAIAGGVCDLGDITEAAAAAGDYIGDAAEEAADTAAAAGAAAAVVAADVQEAAVELADACAGDACVDLS